MSQTKNPVELLFLVSDQNVGVGRRWAREALPVHCDVRDDAVVILSEVLTNTAVHGSAERVRVVLGHTPAGLRGEIHELGPISGHVAPRAGALAQMRGLASGGVIPVEDLPESGRGLAMQPHARNASAPCHRPRSGRAAP